MTPLQRSQSLRQEADAVMDLIHLHDHCAAIGDIIPTGSYYLDLMMYPDIDLYLPPTSPETLMTLGSELVKYDCVKKINFQKAGTQADLKNGLYLKPIIEHGNWERPWKIDIWSLPFDIIEKNQQQLDELKNRMTKADRQLILEYKFSVLTEAGRTPMFSGIYIYQAVVIHRMTDYDDITIYLRENGINI